MKTKKVLTSKWKFYFFLFLFKTANLIFQYLQFLTKRANKKIDILNAFNVPFSPYAYIFNGTNRNVNIYLKNFYYE